MTRTLSNSTKQLYESCGGNKDLMKIAFEALKVVAATGNTEAQKAVDDIEYDKYVLVPFMKYEAERACRVSF